MHKITMLIGLFGILALGCQQAQRRETHLSNVPNNDEAAQDTLQISAIGGAIRAYGRTLEHIDEKYMLDTSLSFPNLMSLVVHKREKDTLLKHLRRTRTYAEEDTDNLGLLHTTQFNYLFYKYLDESKDRSDTAFSFLSFIVKEDPLFPRQALLSLIEDFPDAIRNTEQGRIYRRLLNRKNNIGQSIHSAPRFAIKDPKGNGSDIQSIVDGQHDYYVLMMTASWCMPCHLSYKEHKVGFDAMKEKNIRLISLSVDKNQSAWQKMIAKAGYVQECYLDVDGNKSKVMDFFEYESIPRYILLDRGGKVLGEYNGATVDQLFDKLQIDWQVEKGI